VTAADVLRLGMVVARNVGPVAARTARDTWGGWEEAVRAARSGERMSERLRRALLDAEDAGERVRSACTRLGVGVLLRGARGWPERLRCLTDEPEVLFWRGRSELLVERGVGVVGSRECSPQGADLTRRLAACVAEEGWTVVSGLARGIDAAAHRGALDVDGDTVAVLGCGPELAYPPENAELQERIARDGLLVSEFAPGAPPVAGNFPRRNRVLAALGDALVVVESRLRSGALVTARHALDQGKELFAVPGRPAAPLAAGPLQLLRQGARLVRDGRDLLEDLAGISGGARAVPDDVRALEAVGAGARSAEDVAAALGIDAREARDRLARLELLGLHASEPRVG
jgi:DNA processing protein